MKKLMMILAFAVIIASCKKEEKERDCPVISEESVPAAVQQAFQEKYGSLRAEKWFDRDGRGYSVLFAQNGVKILTEYGSDGSFVKEQIGADLDLDRAGEDDDSGCECETGDDD